MFHYVVTSKTLHTVFSSLYYIAVSLFSIAISLIANYSDGCGASITQITHHIFNIGSPLQIFHKKSI